MTEIIIRYKSRAFISLFIIALVATAIFAWLYVQKVQVQKRGEIDIMRSVYIGLTVGSGILMVRSLINMISKKPVMVINEKGITDYLNLDGMLVPWASVQKAEIKKTGVGAAMLVYLNEPEVFTRMMKKPKQRMADNRTRKMGTPIQVSVSICEFDPTTTVETINRMAGA